METSEGLRGAAKWTLWILLVALSILPMINNMNDLMAKFAMAIGLHRFLEANLVPPVANMISLLLRYVFHIDNQAIGGSIFIFAKDASHELYVGWNCIGWQSLVLLLFSITTGLQGEFTLSSKVKSAIIGLEGVIVINLIRIVSIALVLLRWGPRTAVMFHDHLSQVLTFLWLGLFWYLSNKYILEPGWEDKPWHQIVRGWIKLPTRNTKSPSEGRRTLGLLTLSIIVFSVMLGGFAFMAEVGAQSENWWNNDWNYRRLITQDHSKLDSDLTGFPMLISGTYSELATHAQEDGDDIAFVSFDNSTKLAHEIEYFDGGTGQLIAWVKTDLSSSTDTRLWMYYGNTGASNQQNPGAVWGTSFKIVQHLNETSGTRYDSTMMSNDGTPDGVTHTSSGKVDGADSFDGNDKIDCGTWSLPSTAYTVEAWVRVEQQKRNAIIDKSSSSSNGDGLHLRVGVSTTDNKVRFYAGNVGGGTNIADSTGEINLNEWTHIAATATASSLKLYINGVLNVTAPSTGIVTNMMPLVMGNASIYGSDFQFKGRMDEVRICDVARTDAWIAATYRSTHLPSSFYSCADEIEIPEKLSAYLLPALLIPLIIRLRTQKKE